MGYKKVMRNLNKAILELSRIGDLDNDVIDDAVTDALLALQNTRQTLEKAIKDAQVNNFLQYAKSKQDAAIKK